MNQWEEWDFTHLHVVCRSLSYRICFQIALVCFPCLMKHLYRTDNSFDSVSVSREKGLELKDQEKIW